MKKYASVIFLTLFVGVMCAGLHNVAQDLDRTQTKPLTPYTAPDCQMTLLATTEQGERVYRLTGPYTVVPSIIVVGRNGQVVIR